MKVVTVNSEATKRGGKKTLQGDEDHLHFMADSMPQLVWIARPDGYHEYHNQRWYDFTGTQPGKVSEAARSKLFHPRDVDRTQKSWQHSLETGQPYEIEYRLYHAPTKTYRWMIGRAMPFRDKTGTILRWYGTCTDIEEQKRATQRQAFLANVSKELASTLNYTKILRKVTALCVPAVADWCSVDMYDEHKGFQQVSIAHINPEKISLAQKYREQNPIKIDDPSGVPAVVRTGKTEFYPRITDELLAEYIDDPERLAFMKSLHLHSIIIAPIRIGDTVVGGISFVVSESGRYYTRADLEMTEELAARMSLALTNARLYADSVRDLKNRQKLETRLRGERDNLESRVKERTEQRLQHLVEINRSKDEFISIASHQLRTPATGVKQYIGMLLEGFVGELKPDQLQVLQKAYDSNERQLKIVTDLLKVAQVDAGKVVLRKSDIALNTFIDDIIRDQHSIFSRRHQTIHYESLHPDAILSIDETSIRMVFENIIDNASKYSEEHTVVQVWAEDRGDMVAINVADEGVGIDPTSTRLFEKFSRINNPLSAKVSGTGLGLYWAKKIVDLHGGAVTHKPNKTRGTVFTIELPKNGKV